MGFEGEKYVVALIEILIQKKSHWKAEILEDKNFGIKANLFGNITDETHVDPHDCQYVFKVILWHFKKKKKRKMWY